VPPPHQASVNLCEIGLTAEMVSVPGGGDNDKPPLK